MSQETTGRAALVANNLPTAKTVSAATNATPIVVTTTTAHKLNTNEVFTISGVTGNAAANGTFVAGAVTPTTVALLAYPAGTSVAGTGAGTGGTLQSLGVGKTVPVPVDLTDALRAGAFNVPYEACLDMLALLMYQAGPSGILASRVSDVQVFASNGTWTKPTTFTPVSVLALCIAGGGGGGSGRRDNSLPISGGGGGGGAGISRRWFRASQLSTTETVTIGAGGAGGPVQTSDGSAGIAGSNGTDTTFGTHLIAHGGKGGEGGSTSAAAGGVGGAGDYAGGAGGADTAGVAGSDAVAFPGGAPGGGSGGGLAAGPTFRAGGKGAISGSNVGTASNGGSTDGQTGGSGGLGDEWSGSSPGGGAASNAGAAGAGGSATGCFGVGGGGGGASSNGSNSGAGSAGGIGWCLVISYP